MFSLQDGKMQAIDATRYLGLDSAIMSAADSHVGEIIVVWFMLYFVYEFHMMTCGDY